MLLNKNRSTKTSIRKHIETNENENAVVQIFEMQQKQS